MTKKVFRHSKDSSSRNCLENEHLMALSFQCWTLLSVGLYIYDIELWLSENEEACYSSIRGLSGITFFALFE